MITNEDSLLRKEKTLNEEKSLLTSKFAEIDQKYNALISQVQNQQKEFENEKRAEINSVVTQFTEEHQNFIESCRKICEKIESANSEEKSKAENELHLLVEDENRIKRAKAELKHKQFFSEEITHTENVKRELEQKRFTSKSGITSVNREIAALRKEWEFAKKELEQNFDIKLEKQQLTQQSYAEEIAVIEQRLSESKSSFYGWLNDTVPQWEETVGKVVDKEVLFKKDLSPEKRDNSRTLFGIELNLNAVEKTVKTVEEYQDEIVQLNSSIESTKESIFKITDEKNDRLQSLKTKFGRKINSQKEIGSECEYTLSQSEQELKENSVSLEELRLKAQMEKQKSFEECESELEQLSHKKQVASSNLARIKKSVHREITLKEKERDRRIALAESSKENTIQRISESIDLNIRSSDKRVADLKGKKSNELNSEGADTERLDRIEKQLSEINISLVFIKKNRTLVVEYQKDKRELFDKLPQFKTDRSGYEKKLEYLQKDQEIELEKSNKKLVRQEQVVSQIKARIEEFKSDLNSYENFTKSDIFRTIEHILSQRDESEDGSETVDKTVISLLEEIRDKHFSGIEKFRELQQSINLFASDFSDTNVFRFKVKFNTENDYFAFAEELKEFIEEDKISEFEKRVNERFAHIIHLIGTETSELISKEAEIEKIIRKINADFVHKNFVQAIKQMEMRTQESSNPVVRLLVKIKEFSDAHYFELGENNLFSSSESGDKNRKAVELLKQLVKELDRYKSTHLTLSESFDLQFRIVENDNDSGWVEKLSNVGSEGTDVLVKAMVNILLLNVFKENASKKFKDFKLHCMMDEIGRLHPTNVKGILRFANERNILLINGSPTSQNAIDYKYTYKLSKEQSKNDKTKYITRITRLVKVTRQVER